jgi:hypothetical protein
MTAPVGIKVSVEDRLAAVKLAAKKGAFKNFGNAAASISKDAKSTLEKADGPSLPGQPPHTHRGTFLRRAIRYRFDAEGAMIGPLASVVGGSAAAHEFGGRYKQTNLPARPFMGPALKRAIPRFGGSWRGSVGQ